VTFPAQAFDSLLPVFCPLEPSTPFISFKSKNRGLLAFFAAFSFCSAQAEGSAFTGAVAGGWLTQEECSDSAHLLGHRGFNILATALPTLSKTLTLEGILLVLSHLPQATCETLAPHSSATTRGVSSFRVELWPSWPAPPAPKVHTSPSLTMKKTRGSLRY